ncbi:MAG TPA: hypothetical protein VLB83_02510 [Candidatus Paceibacterota bacterium]|nr:hypothetical protein [Candidatus Paceibacterota bacterium]
MNNSTFLLGMVVALAIGGFGGYTMGQKGANSITAAQVQEMTNMMVADGERMKSMGTMMMQAGAMMEERGAKYRDEEMVMMGKDLSVNGKKHEADGRSMTEGDMMGMTADGAMEDMPGMNMEGMDHSTMGM